MHFSPVAISLLLLSFWTLLGRSVLAACMPQLESDKALLISPAIGASLLVILVYWLNLFLPVAIFAKGLTAALCGLTIGLWLWRRPVFQGPALPFFIPAVLAVILPGLPAFSFGSNWIASANDDWSNCNLGAIRFLSGTFFQKPNLDELERGADYPGFLWYFFVGQGARPGSELVLAWLAGLSGKNPFLVFMPLILALQGVLVLSASAAAWGSARMPVILGAAVLTAISPLGLYAVHQQLIGQIFGVALICATAVVFFIPFRAFAGIGTHIVAAIAIGACWLVYPEITPFLVFAFVIYQAVRLRSGGRDATLCWRALPAPLAMFILLGPYTATLPHFLLNQTIKSNNLGVLDGLSIFPYFLVPNGVAVFFGFSQIGEFIADPWLSVSIAVGLCLLVAVAIASGRGVSGRQIPSIFCAVYLVATALLAARQNSFGVFKLAMFAQAFVWFALAALCARMRSTFVVPAFAATAAILLWTDDRLLRSALSDTAAANPLQGASRDHALTTLLDMDPAQGCEANLATPIPPLIKILGAQQGCLRSFIGRPAVPWNFYYRLKQMDIDANPLKGVLGLDDFMEQSAQRFQRRPIDLAFAGFAGTRTVQTLRPSVEYPRTAATWEPPSVVGRHARVANVLVLQSSDLGSHYYSPEFGTVSLFATQDDPFFRRSKVAAVGRYLLFRVENPSPKLRMVLDLTTSLLTDRKTALPAYITVLGAGPVAIDLSGHGAARVVSQPVAPLMHDGVAYLLLDLGRDARTLPVPRQGLMGLYGNDVALDYRRATAFARLIDVIDADDDRTDYPSQIRNFPADLANPHLHFSGFYEDGWVGNSGFVYLRADAPGTATIRGMLPGGIGIDAEDLIIRAGDHTATRRIVPGSFELSVPVVAGETRIEFSFSATAPLPGGDGRSVSALIDSVSIDVPGTATAAYAPKGLPDVIVATKGVAWDRWASPHGELTLSSTKRGTLVLKGATPGIDQSEIALTLPNGSVQQLATSDGRFEMQYPVEVGTSRAAFGFSKTRSLPEPDGRDVSAIFESIEFIPGS